MLTQTQLQTLAAHLQANTDPVVVAALAAGNNNQLRDWYNTIASPDFWVLRSSIPVDEIVAAIDWGADYAAFKDDMPAIRFLLANGTYDPRQPNARAALNSVFAGAGVTKAAILALATYKASRAEELFAVPTDGPGGGDGSEQAEAAIAVVQGTLTTQDIDLARELI